MKHIYKEWLFIVSNDSAIEFDFDKNFFELSWQQIHQLGRYAQIFHIRPKNGKSPARHLWDSITSVKPF